MDKENKNKEVEYIRSQKEKGVSDEVIKETLLKAGWSEEDVAVGFSEVNKDTVSNEEEKQETEKQTDTSEKNTAETDSSESTADSISEKNQETVNVSNQSVNDSEKKADFTKTSPGSVSGSTEQKKGNLTNFILIGVVVFLVLVGASVAAFYIMKESGVEKSKEEVIVESVVSYAEADSFHSGVEIDIKAGDEFNFFANVEGSFKKSEKIIDSAMEMIFDGGLKFKNQGLTVELGAEGESRLVDGVYYINLSKAPEIPFFPDLSSLENRWLHSDLKDDLSSGDAEDLEEISKFSKDAIDFINKNGVQILEIAQSKNFLKVESLNDKDLYKYLILVDFEKTGDFLNGLAEELPLEEIAKDFPVEERQISESLKELAVEFEEEWEFAKEELPIDDFTLPFELHVEKKSGNIKTVLVDHSINVEINQELSQFYEGKENVKLEIFIKSTFKDFGKTVNVDVPKDSKPFEEAVKEMMEEMMGMSDSQELLMENMSDEPYLIETQEETGQERPFNEFLQAGAGWFTKLR